MKDVDGMLYNLTYDQTVEGDWLKNILYRGLD